MSYYDFAGRSQPTQPTHKKFRLIIITLLAILVLIGGSWALLHQKVKLKAQHTPMPAVHASIPVPLPPPVITHPKEPVAASKPSPSLDFYQVLKKPAAMATSTPAHSIYRLQLAAFDTFAEAKTLAKKLKRNALPVHIVVTRNNDKKPWNRVLVGPFQTAQAAFQVQTQLQKQGMPSLLLIASK